MVFTTLFISFILPGLLHVWEQDNKHEHLIKDIYLSRMGNDENIFITNDLQKSEDQWQANVLIERFVYAVGYNNDFIIAKQYLTNQVEPIGLVTVDRKQTIYHIIDIRSTMPQTYKFDSETDFNNERKQLGVPDTLSFFRPGKIP